MEPFNPFENDDAPVDGDYQGTDQEALMKGGLEISPLIPAIQPMPEGRARTGPNMPIIPSDAAARRAHMILKKRKLNDGSSAEATMAGSADEDRQSATQEGSPTDASTSSHAKGDEVNEDQPVQADAMGDRKIQTNVKEADGSSTSLESAAAKPAATDVSTSQKVAPEVADSTLTGDASQPGRKTTTGDSKFPGDATPSVTVKVEETPTPAGNIPEVKKSPTSPAKSSSQNVLQEKNGPAAPAKPSGGLQPPHGSTAAVAAQLSSSAGGKAAKVIIDNSGGSALDPTKKPPSKKKRPVRAVKKVLIAKKERDIASSLLRDKVDLMDFLPQDDCHFLSENFWIFTAEQLQFLLNIPGSEPDSKEADGEDADSKEADKKDANGKEADGKEANGKEANDKEANGKGKETESKVKNLRMDVLQKLCSSGVMDNDPKEEKASEDALPDEDTKKRAAEESSPEKLAKAEQRLQTWKTAAADYLKLGSKATPTEERFSLDGPIKELFPRSTRNFLASIPVAKLWEFLALKKTETGAVVDMLKFWRQKCGLSELSPLALAKHLLGVASRVETALTAIPPVDSHARRWMSDPIIVMTGAAREFLVDDQGLLSATAFVETRTKDLAAALVVWREKKGMPILKGSGKVAMISGWKANAREEIEATSGDGKVLVDVDLKKAVEDMQEASAKDPPPTAGNASSSTQSPKPKEAPPVKAAGITEVAPVKMPPKLDRQVQYMLHSPLFMEDVLGNEISTILSSAGVKTAAELFEVDKGEKSKLCHSLLEAKKIESAVDCNRVVNKWLVSLRDELQQFGSAGPVTSSVVKAPSAEPAPGPAAASATEPMPAEAKAASVHAAAQSKPQATVQPNTVQSSNSSGETPKRRNPQSRISDPFEALSAATQKFLISVGVTTGEQFLTSRTTDLASEFVQWRVTEGKPELKGLGAIASVSGWKAACRKAAREMGLTKLAELEPTNKSSWVEHARLDSETGKPAKHSKSAPTDKPGRKDVGPKANVLGEKLRVPFAVQLGQDAAKQLRFDVSLRQVSSNAPIKQYLTYKGAASSSKHTASALKVQLVSRRTSSTFPVLVDAPFSSVDANIGARDVRLPFSSAMRGCGLIGLRKYGVRPLQTQDLSDLLCAIEGLVLSKIETGKQRTTAAEPNAFNVILQKRGNRRYEYLLFLPEPIEKGQTVPIVFPTVSWWLQSAPERQAEAYSRQTIEECIQWLSQKDLEFVWNWMGKDILPRAICQENGNNSTYEEECKKRRRIHWVCQRLLGALDGRAPPKSSTVDKNKLVFCRDTPPKDDDNARELSGALAVEAKEEIMAVLETDPVCAPARRSRWSPAESKTFDGLVDTIATRYSSQEFDLATSISEALELSFEQYLVTQESIKDVDEFVIQAPAEEVEDSTVLQKTRNWYFDTYDIASPRLEVVACESSRKTPTLRGRLELRKVEDVKGSGTIPFLSWYQQRQYDIACAVIPTMERVLSYTEFKQVNHRKILSSLKECLHRVAPTLKTQDERPDYPMVLRQPAKPVTVASYQPSATQFFLGIVWPALRQLGWRIDAGKATIDVVYFPPGSRDKKHIALREQHNFRKRTRLAAEVNKIGLGSVPKLSKRICVAVSADVEQKADPTTDVSMTQGVAVDEALDRFSSWIKVAANVDDEEFTARLKTVVDLFRDCFNTIAPLLKVVDGGAMDDDGSRPSSESGRCENLVQFFLIVPGLLQQSGMPQGHVTLGLEAVQDLCRYVSINHQELLDKRFHCPHEEYARKDLITESCLAAKFRELAPPSLLSSSTGDVAAVDDGSSNNTATPKKPPSATTATSSEKNNKKNKSSVVEELVELVEDEDRPNLTDFIAAVMENTAACRATESDASRKYRRIYVGYPGLTCRHCHGECGEGRYFFSTLESLTTASTVIEKHLAKCTRVPVSEKKRIVAARQRHADQRKKLVVGAQQSFFSRLWKRMRTSKIDGKISNGLTTLRTTTGDGDDDKGTDETITTTPSPLPKSTAAGALPPKSTTPAMKSASTSKVGNDSTSKSKDDKKKKKNAAGGGGGGGIVVDNTTAGTGGKAVSDENNTTTDIEFTDRIQLLDYVRTSEAWNTYNTIQDALDKYYSCLDYGGRIYDTTSMPEHFSSEWLLAKIVPRRYEYPKKYSFRG